jgi:signal transduction histidine kinase
MKAQSLRRVLGVQWALFGGALLLGLVGMAAVALYVLEDSFIDARLLAADRALAGERAPLQQVRLQRLADFPPPMRERVAALTPGAVREFRLDAERYVHLRVLTPDVQGPRFLVYDAQAELRVSEGLGRAAPMLALLLGLLLLLAAWLAHRFVGRIEGAATGLLGALEHEPTAAALRKAAEAQPVGEFQRIGHALADSLDARLQALVREEETLRFLAHELRTPLQSARLAMESLAGRIDPIAEARLRRALQRLERSSEAVLWLGESTPVAEPQPIAPILRSLAVEFAPLAARRGQTIRIEAHGDPSWPLPTAAVEAVLVNLLVNAIQHGAPGAIVITTATERIEIRNATDGDATQPGFGLGLELARRLLGRVAWTLEASFDPARAELILRPLPCREPGVAAIMHSRPTD